MKKKKYLRNCTKDETKAEYDCTMKFIASEMNCSIPVSPQNGRVQVSTDIKSFRFGATVIVLCHVGFVLSGNNTRYAVSDWLLKSSLCPGSVLRAAGGRDPRPAASQSSALIPLR